MKKILIGLLIAFVAIPAGAATKKVYTGVNRIVMSDSTEYGGCLIQPSKRIYTSGTTCPFKYISLDCANVTGGEGSSKADGQRRLDLALLARLTNVELAFTINDARKVNGWCVADRVEMLPEAS